MDLHSSQIQGFFNRPVDNLFAEPSIAKYIRDAVPNYLEGVVVSKNAGGAKRYSSFRIPSKYFLLVLRRLRTV